MQFHAATERSLYTISGPVNVHTLNKNITPGIKWSLKGGKKETMENYKIVTTKSGCGHSVLHVVCYETC